ncbi:hypothetical protein L286_06475 [Sphingobium sp. HDIP04]|uniref:Uncharacterized protein n=1 Tax=Sphingobium indicum F2 TaxID=1450518 RepID=A0A8E0WUF5_9SPHN|nr:hypothetical protein L286_06475 [Sphingobium sp. HDIP04]KER37668.1 hypothetical protein AL00_03935 [Sphingobium indicum F2]
MVADKAVSHLDGSRATAQSQRPPVLIVRTASLEPCLMVAWGIDDPVIQIDWTCPIAIFELTGAVEAR